jgi:hypothetical protein
MAACGIAPEDDDGNAASKRPAASPQAASGELVTAAREAAMAGRAAFKGFWSAQGQQQRQQLAPHLDALKAAVENAEAGKESPL